MTGSALSLPPVDVEVIDGKGFPAGFFLTFIPHQTSVAPVEGFTAKGASVCRVFGEDWNTSRRLPVGCTNQPLPGG